MRDLLARLFGRPTFQETLILRLLDQNEALLSRALESRGLEGVSGGMGATPVPSSVPSVDDYEEQRVQAERAEVEEYAAKAAEDSELFEQALYNSVPGNHPQWERWKEVVARAEEMKVLS